MRFFLPGLTWILLGLAASAETFERAFWVWHRAAPLTARESAELSKQGLHTLYWNVGELQNRGATWRWKTPPLALGTFAPAFHMVPVVRLVSEEKTPFSANALSKLSAALQSVAPAGEIQLDFDCPDRLLGDYAAALTSLRRTFPHLSITALTHWSKLHGFPALAQSVEEIAPMFYDMQADPTGVSSDAPPPPLLDPDQVASALQAWGACPIPWRAGLPSFARLTVFDRTGLSRGQIPNWSWDDFCFHKNIHTLGSTHLGVTLFRADRDTRVARTPLAQDELLVSRSVDRAALMWTVTAAHAAGAKGVIFFRLSDETDASGWSLADLGSLNSNEQPKLALRRTGNDSLELVNESDHDLPSRLSGPKGDRDRGYALEIDAAQPLFRDALAGDFWRMTGHVHPDTDNAALVLVPQATRLTFWFSQLPAHGRLQTGLLQLAPGATFGQTHYRIVGAGEPSEWRPVEPAGQLQKSP